MTVTNLTAVFGFIFTVALFDIGYEHIVEKPKRLTPQKNSSIVHKAGSDGYATFAHMDSNFDGVITRHEINIHGDYIKNLPKSESLDAYMFAKSLNQNERILLNGLSMKVAYIAHKELSPADKEDLLKLSPRERINSINARFKDANI